MNEVLKVLLVEDFAIDAELILDKLSETGYPVEHGLVDNALDMRKLLSERQWDLVLCDYSMPGFNPFEALNILREFNMDIPFIVISGTIGEENVIKLMKAGCHDCIMKFNMTRLSGVINREIEEARIRKENRTLKERLQKYQVLAEKANDAMFFIDQEGNILEVNDATMKIYGYTYEEFLAMKIFDLRGTDEKKFVLEQMEAADKEGIVFETIHYRKDHTAIYVEVSSQGTLLGVKRVLLSIVRDITERKQAEKEKETTIKFLRLVNESRNLKELVRETTAFFQQQSGCEAVGIRLCEGDDYPYFETRGFPTEFVLLENRLCDYNESGQVVRDSAGNPVLECMCGNIICGRFDPAQSFFTSRGSFWSNCNTELLAGTTEADRQARTRNRCNGQGYESVALIAIRLGGECLGLLQLNDRRMDLFSLEFLAVWEVLADYLAIAISKFRAEEALKKSESDLKRSQEVAHIGHWTWTRLTNHVKWSDEVCRIFGKDPTTFDGNLETFIRAIHPDDAERFSKFNEQLSEVTQHRKIEYRIVRPDGEIRQVWGVLGDPIRDEHGNIIELSGVVQDITERKRMEEELQKSNERWATIFKTSPVGIYVSRLTDGLIYETNEAYLQMLGYQGAEVIGHTFKELNLWVNPQDRERIVPILHERCRLDGVELQYYRKNGETIDVQVFLCPIEYGDETSLLGTIIDITERKQAEKALRESEEHFRILAETLPQLVWTSDTEGNRRYYDSRFSNYTGLDKEELKEWGWLKVIHPEDIQRAVTYWNEALRTGKPLESEYRIKCYDGKYRWFLARGLPLSDGDGKIIRWFGTSTDIHDRKQLEQELQESNARLHQLNKQVITTLEEERGAVSRELHDEAGQALVALKIFLELMRDGPSLPAEALRQQMDEAVSLTAATLERIRCLAQDLRPPALDTLGLNLTLGEFCREFARRVGLDIEYTGCELPALSGTVSICLYRFLQEALTNVVKHAKADQVRVRFDNQSRQISLMVQDNGIGFKCDKEDLRLIKGVGLIGMRERLEMTGGNLNIVSKPGQGATLIALIPWEGYADDPDTHCR